MWLGAPVPAMFCSNASTQTAIYGRADDVFALRLTADSACLASSTTTSNYRHLSNVCSSDGADAPVFLPTTNAPV